MPKQMRLNSKLEIRMSKQTRNPKSERAEAPVATTRALYTWDSEIQHPLFLRDEGVSPEPIELTERTAQFGESIIRFAKKIPRTPENRRLIEQLVGAGTSIGANFCEAADAVSRKDFKLRIGTCRKESKETMFFLRMVAASEETLKEEARALWREAKELNLICGAIWRK
jgi:four helix bundle protein